MFGTKNAKFQYKILNRFITCNYNLYLWMLVLLNTVTIAKMLILLNISFFTVTV